MFLARLDLNRGNRCALMMLLLTPFALVTPIYTNIFNTRLVHSNNVVMLIIISLFFFLAYMFEFYAKRFIKGETLKARTSSALLFERYVLKFTPYYRCFSSVNSAKSIEQYRKMVWDFIPQIVADALSFVLLFITLSVFISWLSVCFFLFYVTVFGIFFFYRSRLYKHLVDLENVSSDVLKLRISNTAQQKSIPFINRYGLLKKYLNAFSVS